MLERAALHQTRFRTPGVVPDARGVLLGELGLALFPSIDRLVAFLRAYSEDGSLDELLPKLRIRRLVTPLRTREVLLSLAADSSYRMDRVASLARLCGGLTFTGTSRHFVKYRDAKAPLGYDVRKLVSEPADLILYHESFQQSYAYEGELELLDLLERLDPVRDPAAALPSEGTLYATAEVGIGQALIGYLFRWQVSARIAFAEWPPA
ncbi:MAG: hypothetical protein OEY14_13605, partial [Myxococcales bacterium]|nr:hypothetical protein [Myxococcales bacterium]